LGDATGFSVHDAGLPLAPDGANHVQKARFSMVNVPEYGDDGLPVVAAHNDLFSVFLGNRGLVFVGHGLTSPSRW
jgi:hypothetical protein